MILSDQKRQPHQRFCQIESGGALYFGDLTELDTAATSTFRRVWVGTEALRSPSGNAVALVFPWIRDYDQKKLE